MCAGWRLCTYDTRSQPNCSSVKGHEGWCVQFDAACVEFGSVAQTQHCPYVDSTPPPHPPKAKHGNHTRGHQTGKHHGHHNGTHHDGTKGTGKHHGHHNGTHHNGTKGECPEHHECRNECGWKCGCEVVKGLHHQKKHLRKLGAHVDFIASAMLHFRNLSHHEHHHVQHPNGTNTTNVTRPHHNDPEHHRFGLTRMEWDFVRSCHKSFLRHEHADHHKGMLIHNDTEREIEAYHECERHYRSQRVFLAGLRDGIQGVDHPKERDAVCFREAHNWVAEHLERGKHMHDDVRFFVHLPEPEDEVLRARKLQQQGADLAHRRRDHHNGTGKK
jgi:hypothetical protein